jgi:hypothetical protein
LSEKLQQRDPSRFVLSVLFPKSRKITWPLDGSQESLYLRRASKAPQSAAVHPGLTTSGHLHARDTRFV